MLSFLNPPCNYLHRDGDGCSFWYGEEDYEKYLIDNKLVPPSYVPVFNKNVSQEKKDEVAQPVALRSTFIEQVEEDGVKRLA